MNTAIGNYIHYHKKNYEEWGINQRGTSPSENWASAVNSFKKELLQVHEMNTLMAESAELEKQYNDFFYSKDKSNKAAKEFRENAERALQDKLNETFGLAAGRVNIKNLSVKETELSKELYAAVEKTRKKIGKIEIDKARTAQELLEKVQTLYKILDSNEFKNIKQAKTRIKSAKRELEVIAADLESKIQEQNGKRINIKTKNMNLDSMRKIIQEFNRLADIRGQNGLIFEWVLPFVKFNSLAFAKDTLRKELEEMILDKSIQLGTTQVKMDMPDLRNNKITDIDIIQNNVEIKTFTTTSKTDVVITYKDSNNELQEKTVSAKNMKSLSAHLVHQTSLYNILLLSNAYNFATHYLNVVSVAPGEKSGPERIMEANRLLKGLILKFSAEGYDKNNSAEILIINNYDQKYIKVYNIKVLIYLIQKAIIEENGKYSSAVVKFSNDFTLSQSFDKDSKDKRIVKLIQSTSKRKIDVELDSRMLNSYTSLLKNI